MKLTDRERKHVAKIINRHIYGNYGVLNCVEAISRYIESIAKRRAKAEPRSSGRRTGGYTLAD